MARDGVKSGVNGSPAKRQHAKTTAPRIVPAIPLVFEKNRLPKQQQTQASEAVSTPETSTPAREHTPPPDVQEEEQDSFATSAGEHDSFVTSVQEQTPATNESATTADPQPNGVNGQNEKEATGLYLSVGQAESVDLKSTVDHNLYPVAENPPVSTNYNTYPVEENPQVFMPEPTRDLSSPLQPLHHHSRPSSTTSTPIHPEPSTGGIPMPQPRVYGNHDLIFGGFRDSANSSPFPPAGPGTIQSSHNPYPGQPALGPGMAPLYPAGADLPNHLNRQTIPSPFMPGSTGAGGPREMYNQMPPPVHGAPFHAMNQRFAQPPRRPEEHQFPQRYNSGPLRVNGYFPAMPEAQHFPHPMEAMHMQPGMIPSQLGNNVESEQGFRRPSRATPPEEGASMSRHVHSQFGNREFADYMIQISHSRYLFPPSTIPGHSLILARSPKLRSLMRMSQGTYQGPQTFPRYLFVVISDKFLDLDIALVNAIQRLYGGPAPDCESIMKMPIPAGLDPALAVNQETMRFALAYAAAGHYLEIDEIITYAIDLAGSVFGWNTIGSALAFALEGGISPSFNHFEGTAAGTEDKASNSSFDETPNKLESPASAPAYGIYSDRMLHRVIGFILHECPPHFIFFPAVQQFTHAPRLPAASEPRQMSSESKFSQIRFGEMSMQDGFQPPDMATSVLSSILISLPFSILKIILENFVLGNRLGWSRLAGLAHAVVREREQRRQRAVDSRNGAAPQSAVEERLWHNTKWVESLEHVDGTLLGMRLVRHVLGAETPASGSSKYAE